MRKILAGAVFCLTLAMSAAAQAGHGATVVMDGDVLLDKIKGGWAGQTIGCTYGGPTEFKFKGAIIHEQIPIVWYDDYCKDIFLEDPGLYDDVYMDLTFLEVMRREGIDAPAESYASAFANADYKLWHANQAARYNILHGVPPPESGHWRNNPHADDIDFQIESDFIGMICPGMVNAAAALSDRIGHIMNYGDGWYGGVYVSAMYALAYVEDDIPTIVREALRLIPERSKFHRCISDVIGWWRQYPDDWLKCWLEVEDRYAFEVGCPEGVFNAFDIDATINAAYCVMGLLYGGGDFHRTMDIATRCGQDSDCNPATAAGILGVVLGYDRIPPYWKTALERCEDMDFPYTDISLGSVYDINLSLLGDMVEANGGAVSDGKYRIAVQEPETVAWEVSFDGLRPVERRANKYDLGEERTFEFDGCGVVLMGQVRLDAEDAGDGYVALLEISLDGEKSGTVEMPYDYIKRKYDIFHDYGLEEGAHRLTIRWMNPDRRYAVQCKDLVVYSSAAAVARPTVLQDMEMHSEALGRDVPFSLVLPEGYEKSNEEYPVLYLLHGIGGDHTTWLEYADVADVAGGMAASGEIHPCIMVMPDGWQSYYCNAYDGSFEYETFLVSELVPHIDSCYRTRTNPGGRSVMGFSMGGFGALSVGLRHRELFGSAVALSPSLRTDAQYVSEMPQDIWDGQWGCIFGGVGKRGRARLTKYYKLHSPYHILSKLGPSELRGFGMMLDVGDSDALLESNMELHELMQDRGIAHEWEVRHGGHDFDSWNAALPKALRFVDGCLNKNY